MKRSHLLLAVIALSASGCVFDARADLAVLEARFDEANRKVLAAYLQQAEKAEAKGQDGDAIRRECEDQFWSAATSYRAGMADMRSVEARIDIAHTVQRILNYLPQCWRCRAERDGDFWVIKCRES